MSMIPSTLLLIALGLPGTAISGDEAVVLQALHATAKLVRDSNGIAHIFAHDEHDLLLLQGYVHASDRLFQMDYHRRLATGTLAELLGEAALESDVQLRTIGLRRAAERSLAALSPPTVAGLEAYAEGVNLYVQSHALPPEYAALELTQFEPWTPLDSVTAGRLLSFLLSFQVDADATIRFQTYVQIGAALGFDGTALYFEDVNRSAGFDPAATIPDAGGAPAPAGAGLQSAGSSPCYEATHTASEITRLAANWVGKLRSIPLFEQLLDHELRAGSNEWAISGALTASGRPLVGNDPHLDLNAQSVLYPIHLAGGPLLVTGEGFVGVPWVVFGHNDRIAWAGTNHVADVTDTFAEQVVPDSESPSGLSTLYLGAPEPVIAIPESYRKNEPLDGVLDNLTLVPPSAAIPSATLVVPRRNQGPIVQLDPATGQALSLQFVGFSPTRELDALRAINRARNLKQFRAALRFWDVGSLNFVFADVAGHVAYLVAGEIPVREDLAQGTVQGLPPFFIRDGQGGNEWVAAPNPGPHQASPYVVLDEDLLPALVDPPSGWFVNANNDPTGLTRDNDPLNQALPDGGILYFAYAFDGGMRAGRIQERLAEALASGPVSLDDVVELQADTGLRDAQFFVPWLTAAAARALTAGVDPALAALGQDPEVMEAVARLSAWDFTTPTGITEGYDASDLDGALSTPSQAEIDASVAATIYTVWRGRVLEATVDATLAAYGLPLPGNDASLAALRHLLDAFDQRAGIGASGLDFFVIPGVLDPADERDVLLLGSLRSALDLLAGPAFDAAFHGSHHQGDYRWGRLHRIVFAHWLGGPFAVPPAGGAFPDPLPDLAGIPLDGGYATVDAGYHDPRGADAEAFRFASGAVRRFAAQLDTDRPRARSSLPGGTSGILGDPRYVCLLPDWLTNEAYTVWLTEQEALENAEEICTFQPH